MTNITEVYNALRRQQKVQEQVQITIVFKPNRGARGGDGSGTQTKGTVHLGDSFSGKRLEPTAWLKPGEEPQFVNAMVKKYGTARVAAEVRINGARKYESAVVKK